MVKKIINTILYSNIFIGACAVALTFTNQLIVEGQIHFDSNCWFILFSTIFTYSYLKAISTSGATHHTSHRDWATENPQLSKNILLISAIGAAAFFFELNTDAKVVVFILAIVTAFYGFFEIPFIKPKKKLRDLGLVKTVFVGIVWSATTVLVPLAQSHIQTDLMIFLLLRRFLFLLALTMVFEIKDMEGDAANNLETLPLAIGIPNTKLLAQGILFAMIIINLIQYFFFYIPFVNMVAVNLSLLVSIICIQPVNEQTGEKWYYIVLDGMMILQFIFVYIAAKYF